MGWGDGGDRHPPVVISKAWPPVGRPQQCLYRAGQVHKHVAHEEEPRTQKGPRETEMQERQRQTQVEKRGEGRKRPGRWPSHVLTHRKGFRGQIPLQHAPVHVG